MDIDNLDTLDIELPDEFDGLPAFAVGGIVRDTIRGTESHDVDLLVAEVSPEEMESRGFRRIDSPNNETFGVFQDSLGREVAIAREEESTGTGHKDFDVTPVDESVPASMALERDLKRRDFTVNAMALDLRWNVLLDPYGGVNDLQEGVIRAVDDDAFRQDPLRILRGARFAARLDADIAPSTKSLMTEMVEGLFELPKERVRMELEKVLVEADTPRIYFDMLAAVDALSVAYPNIYQLTKVPAGPPEYHEEGSAYVHTMMVLQEMKNRRPNDEIALLMALYHDIGKISTSPNDIPSHPGHGQAGVPIIEQTADHFSMSNEQESAMKEAARLHMKLHDIEELRHATVLDAWQEMNEWERMFDLMVADSKGREPEKDFSEGTYLRRFGHAMHACSEWTGKHLIREGYDPDEMGGEEFGNLLHQKRVETMRRLSQ